MVKPVARHIQLVCCLILAGAAGVRADSFTSWKVGDTAREEISTPAALDVIDAKATARRKAELEKKIPAIFFSHSSITNSMVLKVREAFEDAHSNFLAGIKTTYHKSVLDEAMVQSSDFDYFITAFNIQNKRFLIPTALAKEWARGKSGLPTLTNLTDLLLKTTSRPVRPDEMPDGFVLGDTVRLVPVHSSSDVVTLKDAQKDGTVVSLDSVTTVSRLRGLFRRNFSQEDQLFARQLATYIHPNCFLETKLSDEARAQQTAKVVFVNHYAAGQIIVRRGQIIDNRIHAALAQLSKILPPEQIQPQTVAVSHPAPPTPQPSRPQTTPPTQSKPVVAAANIDSRLIWLAAGAAAVGSIFLVVGIVIFRRRTPTSKSQAVMPMPNNLTLPVELAPQITQVLRSAVAQELAAQRHELLKTQQAAATEVLRLMQRLNELQTPWQERLSAYEKRIQELERELSLRTEENRELLKLKIELLRQQLEVERDNPRVNFN